MFSCFSLSPCDSLGSFLPGCPHADQTAHRPSKPNHTIIQVGPAESRSRNREIAEIGYELKVGGVTFPVGLLGLLIAFLGFLSILEKFLALHNSLSLILIHIPLFLSDLP